MTHKGFCCYFPSQQRIYITRHAKFDELAFPLATSSPKQDYLKLDVSSFIDFRAPISNSPAFVPLFLHFHLPHYPYRVHIFLVLVMLAVILSRLARRHMFPRLRLLP